MLYHQYHHLEEDTPIFDYITGTPNVARKGISTIDILDRLTKKEEEQIRYEYAQEVELVNNLPQNRMTPSEFTPGQ